MSLALLLLLAQTAPAPAAAPPAQDDVEEVVIQAKLGLTTMLFDKGSDGKLRNCRIMVSSGSQKRDVAACQATPVCYAKTADTVTDCRELTILDQAALIDTRTPPAPAADPTVFTTLKLVPPPSAPAVTQFGPISSAADDDAIDKQRVKKLPPPPSAPSDGPAVKVVLGDGNTDNRP